MARSVTGQDGTVYEVPDGASDEMVRDFLAEEYVTQPASGSGLGAAAGVAGDVFSGLRGVGLGLGGLGGLGALIYGARRMGRRGARPTPVGAPPAARIPGLQSPGAPLGFEPAFSAVPGDEVMRASQPDDILAPADVATPPKPAPSAPGRQVVGSYERRIPQRKKPERKTKVPKGEERVPIKIVEGEKVTEASRGKSQGVRSGRELANIEAERARLRGTKGAPVSDDLTELLGKSRQGLQEMRAAGAGQRDISKAFSRVGQLLRGPAKIAGVAAAPLGLSLAFAEAAEANQRMKAAGVPDTQRRLALLEILSQGATGVGPQEAIGELRRIAEQKLAPLGRDN